MTVGRGKKHKTQMALLEIHTKQRTEQTSAFYRTEAPLPAQAEPERTLDQDLCKRN